jgi:pilus assembly protein Flp/PilA
MRRLIDCTRDFLAAEDGPTAVEYAVMLALIILVCITAIKSVGTAANDQFNAAATGLAPAP